MLFRSRTQKLGGRDPFPQKIADAQRWKDKPKPKRRARVVASSPAARTIAFARPVRSPRTTTAPTPPATTGRIAPQPYTPPIALWTDLWRYRFDMLAGVAIVVAVFAAVYGIQYAERRAELSRSPAIAIPNIAPTPVADTAREASATDEPILALTDRYYGHTAPVTAIAVAPTDGRFASSSDNGIVRVWNGTSDDRLYDEPIGTSPATVKALSFSTDGRRLVGATDRELVDWETERLKQTNKRSLAAGLQAIVTDAQGMLAFGQAPSLGATVWQLDPSIAVYRAIDTATVRQASFSADGRRLATLGEAIAIWDLETGDTLATLDLEPDAPIAIALSPDGRYLAVSQPAKSDTIELWSVERNQIVQSVLARDITTMTFSPDGSALFGGDRLGAISRWRLEL